MNPVQVTAYVITVAEFSASSVFTLAGSPAHLRRLQQVAFPLRLARILACIELVAVAGLAAGWWIPSFRWACGSILALCFLPILIRALQGHRPIADTAALTFFMACAVVAALS
jgi:hypothetical protein